MNNVCRALRLPLVLGAVALSNSCDAQTPARVLEPAIVQLADRIGKPLEKAHARKVIVADLTEPEGEAHPVGSWLADRLSESLIRDFPDLEIVARPADSSALNLSSARSIESAQKAAQAWAHHLKAKVVITGSFAKSKDVLSVSVVALEVSGSQNRLADATGTVSLTDEMVSLSSQPIPKSTGIQRAGVAGNGFPSCIACPPPDLRGVSGITSDVGLQATITTEGRATNIFVTRSGGADLDRLAIAAVSKWKFKPATDPKGQPVPVVVPIVITFRSFG